MTMISTEDPLIKEIYTLNGLVYVMVFGYHQYIINYLFEDQLCRIYILFLLPVEDNQCKTCVIEMVDVNPQPFIIGILLHKVFYCS